MVLHRYKVHKTQQNRKLEKGISHETLMIKTWSGLTFYKYKNKHEFKDEVKKWIKNSKKTVLLCGIIKINF